MKKFLLILLIAILIAVGTVAGLFYKSFDEESFKEQIVNSTKQLTGCDFVVAGDMNVKLLPSPIITLNNVVIKNNPAFSTGGDLVKVESIEARIRFASLFKNPLVVEKIVLNNPQIDLRKNEKGENNWNFTFLRSSKNAVSDDATLGRTFVDMPPQFQNIELKNGLISYQNDLSGVKYQLKDINATVTSSSVTGPFDFTGSLKKDEIPLNVSLFVSMLNPSAQTNFNLSVTSPNSKTIFSIHEGKFEKLGGLGQTFTGSFTFNIPKLSDFLLEKYEYKNLPESLNKTVSGNGKFNATEKVFSLNEVALHYGTDEKENALENAIMADISFIYPTRPDEKTKITTQFRSSLLNLDTFLPYIPRQDSWQSVMEKIIGVLPQNIDVVVNSEQVVWNEKPIKDFVFSASLQNKDIVIREIKALLPEESLLQAKGVVEISDKPVIKADYSLEAKNPQKLIDWLKIKELPVSTDKVNELNVSGQLQLRPQDLTLANMDLSINNSSVKGGLVFALTEPTLTGYVNLNMRKLNFDDFIPYEANAEEKSFTEWLQDTKADLEKSPLLSDINLSLTLSGQDITFKTLPIDQFSYEGKIEKNAWRTDSLRVSQIAMSNIDYKGTIQKLPDSSIQFKDVQIELEMPKSLLLLNRLKIRSPLVNNNNKVSLKANVSGSFEKMNVASDISFTQGRIFFKGTIEKLLMANPNYSLLIKLSHPNFQQFLHLFGIKFDQFPSLNGNFAFEGNLKGVQNQLSLTKTELSIGSQKLQGDMDITKTESSFSAQGSIQTPYLYFDKFISTAGLMKGTNAKTGKSEFSNKLFAFEGLDDVSLSLQLSAEKASLGKMELGLLTSNIRLSDKIFMLDKTKATLNGGSVELSALLNYSMAVPTLKSSLKFDKVPVRPDLITLGMFRLKSGELSSMADLNTRGNSFEDMMRELSGTGRFIVKEGVISSLNLNAFERRVRTALARNELFNSLIPQLSREVTIGETAFDSLEGSFAITNGMFRTSDTILKTTDANAIIQTNLDIPEWTINSSWALSFKNFTGYPPISIIVKGLLHNPQTNVDFSSFIKHLETTSADVKERLQKQEQERIVSQARKEAKERTNSLARMLEDARNQIDKTEQIMQLASTPSTKTEFVRVKDAFVVLQELANKPNPSEADTQKASTQATLIESRTSMILKEVTQKAVGAIRQNITQVEQQAEQVMRSVNKINQRLYGVEQIEEAYKKSFSAMTFIQQSKTFADSSSDLDKLNDLYLQVQDALDIIKEQYNNIAKFDVDAEVPEDYQEAPKSSVQGSIRRAS